MKKLVTLLTVLTLGTLLHANANIDKMVKKQCQIVIDVTKNPMMSNTYLLGIVEGISYAVPYNDATDLVKQAETKKVMEMACKNAIENRTLHGFDSDYKWQVMKLSSKKHSTMEQQY